MSKKLQKGSQLRQTSNQEFIREMWCQVAEPPHEDLSPFGRVEGHLRERSQVPRSFWIEYEGRFLHSSKTLQHARPGHVTISALQSLKILLCQAAGHGLPAHQQDVNLGVRSVGRLDWFHIVRLQRAQFYTQFVEWTRDCFSCLQ